MASIVFIAIFLNTFSPLDAKDNAIPNAIKSVFTKVETGNTSTLKNELDVIQNSIHTSKNPIAESRKFLHSFINEINVRYGLNLNLIEACRLVRENFHFLNLSPKEKDDLAITLDLLERDYSTVRLTVQGQPEQCLAFIQAARIAHLYWPWEWNWFGLNKQHSHHKNRFGNRDGEMYAETEIELPGNCYFGLCEGFAGALLCIIPHPITWAAGTTMIIDGGRRLVDGIIQLGDERRYNPNHAQPKISLSLPTRFR
jgi:hypothetical protein